MYAFKSYSSFFLLHGSFFLLASFVIFWVLERDRHLKQVSAMAALVVTPFFLISFMALFVHFAFKVTSPYLPLIAGSELKLACAFPVLWLGFKMHPKLAIIYTIILLVVSQFSPVFVRALLQLFDGNPAAMFSLLLAAAVPLVLLVAARRIENAETRMLARSILIAALIAPTLIVSHGGMAILPAGMIWPFLFQHGVDIGIQLFSLAISMGITTVVLLVTYRAIKKAQAEGPARP